MDENQLNKTEERDALDGGFAVVDRERIIEEETREITPWYKHFIEAFTAPSKMIEACYGQEPYKGASYGVVGSIIFTVIYMILTFMNPIIKEATIAQLRTAGITEDALNQTYSISMISGIIIGIISIFFSVLMMAIIVQIIKCILKDKAKFANLYKMLLVVQMVTTAVLVLDALIANIIGLGIPMFQLGTLLGDITTMPMIVQAISPMLSLSNIVMVIWLIIGYKAVTHSKMSHAVIVAAIYELLTFGMTYGSLCMVQMAQASMGVM